MSLYVTVFMFLLLSISSSACKGEGVSQAQTTPSTEKGRHTANEMATTENIVSDMAVDGIFMKAFAISYEAFSKETAISAKKKLLENYSIVFQQEEGKIKVHFIPKRKSGEQLKLGGSTELGKKVTYTVNLTDFKILERKFYK